jgi:hypothetical protein
MLFFSWGAAVAERNCKNKLEPTDPSSYHPQKYLDGKESTMTVIV